MIDFTSGDWFIEVLLVKHSRGLQRCLDTEYKSEVKKLQYTTLERLSARSMKLEG